MDEKELLIEAFDRLPELISNAVDGLTAEQLRWVPAPGANSVGWLIWHLTRIQDHHLADILNDTQIWVSGNWARRFGLAADPDNTGYAHSPGDVASVHPDAADALIDYYAAVAQRTRKALDEVMPVDLGRIVDDRWDPPVTLGVRLISVLGDDLQHAGQAAYVRGLLTGAA
jgi:hypothetical protein